MNSRTNQPSIGPMSSAQEPSEIATADLVKKVAFDVQDLVQKEAALAKAESSLAVRAEVDAAVWILAGTSLAVMGLTISLTALLIGIYGWKVAVLVGSIILLASIAPAVIGYRRHRRGLIPNTTATILEDARWVRDTLRTMR